MARILIIEDEAKVAEFMKQALEEFHFETKVLSNAQNAIQTIDSFHPDLILLDAMLPGMNGFDFLKVLRQKHNMPVIMITALGLVKHKFKADSPKRANRLDKKGWPPISPATAYKKL